jgi:Tol biopolymer transport system component
LGDLGTDGSAPRRSAAEEAQFISHARQLIYEGKRSGEGYFSSDGKMLIFQSEREEGNPFYQIYLLDLETGDIRRVSSGVGKTTCGFFRPDGKEAIFASTHLDPQATERQRRELELRASGKQRRYSWDYDASMDIFATEPDGGPLRRLTDTPGTMRKARFLLTEDTSFLRVCAARFRWSSYRRKIESDLRPIPPTLEKSMS